MARTFYDKLVRGPSLTGGIPTDNPFATARYAAGSRRHRHRHPRVLPPETTCYRVSPVCANLPKQLFLFSSTSRPPAMDLTDSKWTCIPLFVTFTSTRILPAKATAVGAQC